MATDKRVCPVIPQCYGVHMTSHKEHYKSVRQFVRDLAARWPWVLIAVFSVLLGPVAPWTCQTLAKDWDVCPHLRTGLLADWLPYLPVLVLPIVAYFAYHDLRVRMQNAIDKAQQLKATDLKDAVELVMGEKAVNISERFTYAWDKTTLHTNSSSPVELFSQGEHDIGPDQAVHIMCSFDMDHRHGQLSLGLRLNDTLVNGRNGHFIKDNKDPSAGVVRWFVSPADQNGLRLVRLEWPSGLEFDAFGEKGTGAERITRIAIYGSTDGTGVKMTSFHIYASTG